MAHGEIDDRIVVEVAYARADWQIIIELEFNYDVTAKQAIEASGILERCPEIDLASNRVGMFGKMVSLDRRLRDRDRVEIYRPLSTDPKARRRRAAAGLRKQNSC
jgi:putative ubiquitin-RnfH superfamily antitoxin RatB of RatAB toxin-antitoxin module